MKSTNNLPELIIRRCNFCSADILLLIESNIDIDMIETEKNITFIAKPYKVYYCRRCKHTQIDYQKVTKSTIFKFEKKTDIMRGTCKMFSDNLADALAKYISENPKLVFVFVNHTSKKDLVHIATLDFTEPSQHIYQIVSYENSAPKILIAPNQTSLKRALYRFPNIAWVYKSNIGEIPDNDLLNRVIGAIASLEPDRVKLTNRGALVHGNLYDYCIEWSGFTFRKDKPYINIYIGSDIYEDSGQINSILKDNNITIPDTSKSVLGTFVLSFMKKVLVLMNDDYYSRFYYKFGDLLM